jgi:hypothetical protein
VDHLLLHYSLAVDLWNFALRSFGIHWVLPGKVVDLLFRWRNWLEKHSLDIWNLGPLCLMWTLWRECNCRMFEDVESSKSQLIELFTNSWFDWSRVWGFTINSSIAEFIELLYLVHTNYSL